MYWNGEGVPKDPAAAVRWFRKAADQGVDRAQFALGLMYFGGHGVAKDRAEAMKWYRMAAEQGYAPAQYRIGVMYLSGEVVAKDYTEAYKWEHLAAIGGVSDARNFCHALEHSMTPDQIAKAKQAATDWAIAHPVQAK
jgi:TPR repeat protein